jgi:uncharacterized protein YjbJ (UPF0337 family)
MSTQPIWNQIQGSWKQLVGQAKTQWGKLTDDDLMQINGDREKMVGKLQQRYGVTQAEANRQVDEWANKLKF